MGPFSEKLDSFLDFELPSQIRRLVMKGWPNLRLKSLPQQIQHLTTSLTSLEIDSFDGVEALPEWLGNLTSLNTLSTSQCKNLVSLPAVEVIQRLTKLQELVIEACPRLGGRSALKSGPEWHKISHIPRINAWRLFQSGWGNLTSLTHLRTKVCENLVYLPAVEVMQRLTKIVTCSGRGGRSALLSCPEWHKIFLIPCISSFDRHSFASALITGGLEVRKQEK
ncbi:unnamed protein product [Prunus armeniaca]